MLVALAFLIAAFVFYFDFVVPAYGDMQALKGRELGEQNFFSQESNTITQVQKLIDQGWELAGSMAVSRAFYDENFYQPMVISDDPVLTSKLRKEEANRRKY